MIVTVDTGILVGPTVRANGPARRLVEMIASDSSHEFAVGIHLV